MSPLGWHSGNRSVLTDHHLSGAVAGLTLSTTAPDVYRALVETTAFGTRVITDACGSSGLGVDQLVMAGGWSGTSCSCRSMRTCCAAR